MAVYVHGPNIAVCRRGMHRPIPPGSATGCTFVFWRIHLSGTATSNLVGSIMSGIRRWRRRTCARRVTTTLVVLPDRRPTFGDPRTPVDDRSFPVAAPRPRNGLLSVSAVRAAPSLRPITFRRHLVGGEVAPTTRWNRLDITFTSSN